LNEPLTKSIRSVDLVTAGIGRLIEDTTVAMDRNRELHREGRPGIRRPAVALLGIVYARLNRREDAERMIEAVRPDAENRSALSHIHNARFNSGLRWHGSAGMRRSWSG
jgi:hypothetical protein